MAFDPSVLKPGDILLYRPKGFFGFAIHAKTWHRIGHCEGYVGNGKSVASRDGQGVERYDLRLSELAYVLRPTTPLNLEAAGTWFKTVEGKPYGWRDLANFSGLWHPQTDGLFCSEFLTMWLRAGDMPCFDGEPPIRVAPFEFLLLDNVSRVYSDGQPD